MVGRHLAVAILLFGCLVWRGTASHDEDSATKHLDELFEMISNDLAENDVCLDMELPRDCSITADCLKITCKEKFVGKNTVVTVNLNRCDEPVTVSINVEVKEEGIDWTHVFTSGDELSVPGWSFDLQGVGKAGLFVKVLLEPEDDELTLKVFLEGGAKVGSASVVPLKVEVVSQKMSISTEYCGFVRWWEAHNTAVRIVLVLVFLLLVLSIITGCFCCCCCCCCKPCKRRTARIV